MAERLLLPTVEAVQRIVVGGTRSLKGNLAFEEIFGHGVKNFSPTRWMGLIEAALKNFTKATPIFTVRLAELQQLAVHDLWPALRCEQLTALLPAAAQAAAVAAAAQAAAAAVNGQQGAAADDEDEDAAPRAWRPAQMQLLKPFADLLSGAERLTLELCLARDLGIFLLQVCYEIEGNGFLMPFVTTYMEALEPALKQVADKNMTAPHFPQVVAAIAAMPVSQQATARGYVETAAGVAPLYMAALKQKPCYSDYFLLACLAAVLFPESPLMQRAQQRFQAQAAAVQTELEDALELIKTIVAFKAPTLCFPYADCHELHDACVAAVPQ